MLGLECAKDSMEMVSCKKRKVMSKGGNTRQKRVLLTEGSKAGLPRAEALRHADSGPAW